MSLETHNWAAKQRPGNASAKLVLLGLASCADANHCAHPSVQWLCDFGDLNRKTVIHALQRLEDGMFPMIEDTGRRVGRTAQVKVYRLAAYKVPGVDADPASETVPKAEQFQKRNSSVLSSKQSQKRDTEPFLEPIPLSPSNERDAPRADFAAGDPDEAAAGAVSVAIDVLPHPLFTDVGKGDQGGAGGELGGAAALAGMMAGDGRGKRLPDDWAPPAPADLSPVARNLVGQWPAGAYQAVCETFRLHWLTETRAIGKKRDWGAALAKWLINDHPKVMRDAKAGVSFAALVLSTPSTVPMVASPMQAKAREDERSAAIHAILRQALGDRPYQTWLEPAAIVIGAQGAVFIVSASSFVREWLEQHFTPQITAAARQVIGRAFDRLKFEVETKGKG